MSTRIVELTIIQTETFGIYVEVPEDATEADVNEIAEQVLHAEDVLESAYSNNDCNTYVYDIDEAMPSLGTWVHTLDGSHLDSYRFGA